VAVGGKPAFIAAITPGQINAQAPDIPTGATQVVVTTPIRSVTFGSTVQTLSPAFFLWPGSQPVATHTDYSWAVKNGTFSGSSTVPAKPGEVILLWGTGFGATSPAVAAGQVPSIASPVVQAPVTVSLGGTQIPVVGAALSSYPAIYQVAIQIPANQPDGDYPIVATENGSQSPVNVMLTIHR
jgi:uncharacterized protein (TIGR03437 family)